MKRTFLLIVMMFSAVACDEAAEPGDGAAAGGAAIAAAGAAGLPPAAGGGAAQAVPGPPSGTGGAPMAGVAPVAGSAGSAAGVAGGALVADAGVDASAAVVDAGSDAGSDAGQPDAGVDAGAVDPTSFAAGLHELFMHDACTGAYPPQPDTCLHEQLVEREVSFGGEPGTVYDVTLRIRGIFEPTTIRNGQTPLPQHPYFKVGGSVAALDWSHWHIEVSEPAETYWLNHYPSTGHIIYQEDFEATLPIAGGATVVVRVIDGNDREIDNAEEGPADRRQRIDGVTDEVLDGQMVRLDVISVEAR